MKFSSILMILLISFSIQAQVSEQYSKVKINILDKNINILAQQGIDVAEGLRTHKKYLTSIYNQDEIALIKKAGFEYEILIEDASAYYHEYGNLGDDWKVIQNRSGNCGDSGIQYDYETPINYQGGNMGGYQTYNEILATLADMNAQYPELISPLEQIGDIFTHDNNPILYLRLSDNAATDEVGEPEILFTSLHHAREPNSASQLLFYMWYLLENYETDPEVKYLVDNTEMYFVPIVNPDGYLYNELTDPLGGGFWRKNRWPDSNGDVRGVDLNRNYGFFWGYDDVGSSPDPDNNTYRGVAPFSEPETQAIKLLSEEHEFVLVQNYHTSGDLLIHPWGYSDMPTDEDSIFKSMAAIMIQENNFTVGTGTETVGYIVNGEADDWQYGEQTTKGKSYAYTPEIGPSFWPDPTSIDFLNRSTMHLNLSTTHLALNYGYTEELFASELITDRIGTLSFRLHKNGLQNGPLDLEITSSTAGVSVTNNSFSNISMTQNQYMDVVVNYEIDGSISDGEEVVFETDINNGLYIFEDSYNKTFRMVDITETVVSGNDDMTGYTATGDWGISTDEFFSAPSSITDSPIGRYQDNVDSEISLDAPIDLTNADDAYLNFYAKWEIENDYDFVQIQLSSDGVDYTAACGRYTNAAVPDQLPDPDPLYDGVSNWVKESICLTDYVGGMVYVKFVFHSDQGLRQDGFYFDDVSVETFKNVSSVEDALIDDVSVIPNPFSEQVTINYDGNDNINWDYQVRDIMGRLIAQGKMNSSKILETSLWNKGSYLISIAEDGRRIYNTKLIKAQ